MKIRKAVITAAGKDQRSLPLQKFVDLDGAPKAALQIIVEEAISAGAEEICLIVHPGDEEAFRAAAGDHAARISLVVQTAPRGYGHALFCARPFVGAEPFLHLVSDHLYISYAAQRCGQQLVAVAEAEACAVSAVQATRESQLAHFGAVGGHRVPQTRRLYEIETVAEKPTPTHAEQQLIVPGLRAGHYLCFFGMHILTPAVMDLLADQIAAAGEHDLIPLSPALAALAGRERYLAFEIAGARYNLGVKYGLLTAQLALALGGADRDDVLVQLLELLAKQRHV